MQTPQERNEKIWWESVSPMMMISKAHGFQEIYFYILYTAEKK